MLLANAADYRALNDLAPTDAAPTRVQFAVAQAAVYSHLKSAVYVTDSAHNPVDPDVRMAIIAAMCEQARAYMLQDEATAKANAASPLGAPLASASIGGVTWSAAGGQGLPAGYAGATATDLAPAASALLAFLPRRVSVSG